MGRYYSGDIEGKFWFGIQPSDAADRFGVTGEQTQISYSFDSENLPKIQEELKKIEDDLGETKLKLDKFFEKNFGYNDEELSKYLKCPILELRYILREYADYQLGKQIAECIEKNGFCYFDAEI